MELETISIYWIIHNEFDNLPEKEYWDKKWFLYKQYKSMTLNLNSVPQS